MTLITLLSIALITGSAVWVYLDASGNRVGYVPGNDSVWNMSPGSWASTVLMIWVFGFPAYLAKRSALLKLAETAPQASTLRGLKATCLALPGLVLGGLLLMPPASTLPECASEEVRLAALRIIADSNDNPDVSISQTGEVEAESMPLRRVCRAAFRFAENDARWLKFSVERHGDGHFIEFIDY